MTNPPQSGIGSGSQQPTGTSTGGISFSNLYGRNEIHVTHLDIPTVVEKTWKEVVDNNNPPTLFRRGNRLVRIEEKDNGDLVIVPIDRDRMRGYLSRICVFTDAWSGRPRVVEPPNAVIRDMLVNIDVRIPFINRIVKSPIFAFDGSIINTPGYHESARVYYDVPFGLMIPNVSDYPTEDEVTDAILIYEELLTDFPFEGQADKAHAFALSLQLFCRDMIDGPTPLYGSESPVIGVGKGMMVDALLTPALGPRTHTIAQPTNDDEWRKQMATSLSEGPASIKIDNVTRPVDSGVFANILTTDEFATRILSTMINISLPVRCAWIMTGNNPILSTEISRRYVRMRLIPDVDKPWLRDKFKHPDLLKWAIENRGQLIWAALTMIRYGIQNNPGNFHRLGSFENWSNLMGNILDAIGIPGFLGNINSVYEQSDVETAMWTNLVSIWWDKNGSDDMLSSEIYSLMMLEQIDIPVSGKTDKAMRTSFGRALASMKDRVFGIENGKFVRLVKSAKVVHKAVMWKLVDITPTMSTTNPSTSASPTVPPVPNPADPEYEDLDRERLAVEAAQAGEFEVAEELIDQIDDSKIKDRATLTVEQIQFLSEEENDDDDDMG